jgi:hypothetical protein
MRISDLADLDAKEKPMGFEADVRAERTVFGCRPGHNLLESTLRTVPPPGNARREPDAANDLIGVALFSAIGLAVTLIAASFGEQGVWM